MLNVFSCVPGWTWRRNWWIVLMLRWKCLTRVSLLRVFMVLFINSHILNTHDLHDVLSFDDRWKFCVRWTPTGSSLRPRRDTAGWLRSYRSYWTAPFSTTFLSCCFLNFTAVSFGQTCFFVFIFFNLKSKRFAQTSCPSLVLVCRHGTRCSAGTSRTLPRFIYEVGH